MSYEHPCVRVDPSHDCRQGVITTAWVHACLYRVIAEARGPISRVTGRGSDKEHHSDIGWSIQRKAFQVQVVPVSIRIREAIRGLNIPRSGEVNSVIALAEHQRTGLIYEIINMSFPFRADVEEQPALVARENGRDAINAVDVITQAVAREDAGSSNGNAQRNVGRRFGRSYG